MDAETNNWSKLHDYHLVGEQFITPGIDPLTRRSGSQQEMVGAWCLSPRGGRQARSGGWQIGLGLRYCALSQGGWRGGGKTEEGAVLWSGILLVWVKGGDKLNKKQQQVRRFWIIRRKPWHFAISIVTLALDHLIEYAPNILLWEGTNNEFQQSTILIDFNKKFIPKTNSSAWSITFKCMNQNWLFFQTNQLTIFDVFFLPQI